MIELLDYLVEVEFIQDSSIDFIHFTSSHPVGSTSFFDDLYDCILSRGYDYPDFRVLGFENGF
uniref:Uncharacterized protein n=1 Tax=Dulem virus 172 TaxID=3145649 RepID=A0AAU8AW45_9VIRU